MPIVRSGAPIKDSQGRIRYIVDLEEDESGKPDRFTDAHHKIGWQKARSGQLIDNVTRLRGVELLATTSLVGTSFTAYLTENQVEQFAKDKRVKLITQDAYLQPSALWNSITDATGQIRPWGLYAMGVASAGSSNGTATVYVLDTGVEAHNDLVLAGQLTALATTTSGQPVNPVGCYSHATHVAGIIGAADNGIGVMGVLPGVRIVSFALGDTNSGSCSGGNPISAFVAGLEKIIEQVQIGNKVAVVNISFNRGTLQPTNDFSSTGTVGMKMRAVATPTFGYVPYKGALVVQSAGNQFSDACNWAYNAPNSSDGIMVVGGLDDNGQPVVRLNGLNGYVDPEPGSNSGSCVEVWAPSQRVLSTWSGGSVSFLSGTSMAAPHIAGFAARLLESNPSINTSVDLETAVRAKFTTIGGYGLQMPHLANIGATAKPTLEIAEASSRSWNGQNAFDKFADGVNLRFESVGAAYCSLTLINNGAYYLYQYTLPALYILGPYFLPPGDNSWSITCFSAQGTQSTVVANGRIKRRVSLGWLANTTSTGGNWQTIANGGTVTWSLSAPFDQFYYSTGTDANSCRVRSYGYTENVIGDPSNPGFNQFQPFSQTLLWDSQDGMPASYQFPTFYFGDPNTASYPLGPYHGYKWLLTCWNTDGDSKSTVMYGSYW